MRRSKFVFLLCCLTALFCCANLFGDNAVDTQDTTIVPDTTIGGIPGSDLSAMDPGTSDLTDWFLNLAPSDQWTTAANIATMNAWLSIVEEYSGDPAILAELNGLGMIDPGTSGTDQAIQAFTQTDPGIAPEPAVLGWFGGLVAILMVYAGWRGVAISTRPPSPH